MDDGTTQLLLPFTKYEPLQFRLYNTAANGLAVEHIQRLAGGADTACLYLWGEPGTGKSHLLQAACHYSAGVNRSSVYIPLSRIEEFSPGMLQGLSSLDLVCMDDIGTIAGRQDWELAVFNLYNQLQEAGTALIIASYCNPLSLPVSLPDLKSRLGSGITYHLTALDDNGKKTALQLRARERGFEIPAEVADYLLHHIARDTGNIFRWLDRLDNSSLVAQKKLTVPFVRQLLEQDGAGRSRT